MKFWAHFGHTKMNLNDTFGFILSGLVKNFGHTLGTVE
jgi:hypothetical protein